METYYDILGIGRNASQQQIKEAYYGLMKHHHPDHNADSADATHRAQQINTAYDILKDPVRRYEYDNLLMLQSSADEGEQGFTLSQGDDRLFVASGGAGFVCEGCGMSDSTLRVSIFTGVFSFFYSWKKAWGRILCSKCRLKYGLLWNLLTWITGWWAVPFGPWHTVLALWNNARGGSQPPENNSLLLGSLAHGYYVDHKYADALACVTESLKFGMTKGGLEFRAQVIEELRRNPRMSARTRLHILNPLAVHIPVLATLAAVTIWGAATLFAGGEQPDAASEPAGAITVSAEPVVPPDPDEFSGVVSAFGIDTDAFNRAYQKCLDTRALIAQHIASSMPGNQAEDSTKRSAYIIHWDLLSDSLLHAQEEILGSVVTDASFEMRKLGSDPGSDDPGTARGRKLLNREYDEMVSLLFNCTLLSSGTTFLKPVGTASGLYPDQAIDEIIRLGDRSEVTEWLARAKYDERYRNLTELLQTARMNSGRYRVMRDRLLELQTIVRDDSSQLATIRTQMDQYRSGGSMYEYNRLSALYETRVPQANQHVDEYNEYLRKYNEFTAGLRKDDISSAILACLDASAVFPAAMP